MSDNNLDLDSSDSDDEVEITRFHSQPRHARLPWPWFVGKFFTVTAGQLSDGTRIDDGKAVVTHTYRLTFLQRVFVTLDYPTSSRLSFLLAVLLQCAIMLSIVSAALASSALLRTVPKSCVEPNIACNNDPVNCPGAIVCYPLPPSIFAKIDTACFLIFWLEYFIRLSTSLFTPPRLVQLLSDDWDSVEENERFAQMRKMCRDSANKEAANGHGAASANAAGQRAFHDELSRKLYEHLAESSKLKNGSDMYCACSLHAKLTAIVMFLMHRPVTSSPDQLGSRHLERFRTIMHEWEEEFEEVYRAEGGDCCFSCYCCRCCCSHVDDSSHYADVNSDAVSAPDAADNPEMSTNATNAAEAASLDTRYIDSTKAHAVWGKRHRTLHTSATYLKGLQMLRQDGSNGALCTSTRLPLRDAFRMDIEHHWKVLMTILQLDGAPATHARRAAKGKESNGAGLGLALEGGLSALPQCRDCSYEDDKPMSDPNWGLLQRAVRFVFAVPNLIDLASVCPLLIILIQSTQITQDVERYSSVDNLSTTFLRVVRCFRLMRTIRLDPYSAGTLYLLKKALQNSFDTLIYLLFMCIVMAVLYAFIMHQLEVRGFISLSTYSFSPLLTRAHDPYPRPGSTW